MTPARSSLIWPGFSLVLDRDAGTVATVYACGRASVTGIGADDVFHAERLGLTPLQHRMAHELAHHLVGLAMGRGTLGTGCEIVWSDAHGRPLPADAGALEHAYTAATYAFIGAPHRPAHGHEYAKLGELHDAGVDLAVLAGRYRWLLQASEHASEVVVHG